MNLKRVFEYSVLLWIIIFAIISIVMFLPWFKDSQLRVQIAWWVLEIPVVLIWAKMYFKVGTLTWKKGLHLGLVALVVGTILDMIITVPLFVRSYTTYFGSWTLYVGYLELLVLTTLAGGEFDATFSKPAEDKKAE